MTLIRIPALLLTGLALAGCNEDAASLEPTEIDIAQAETLRPDDPYLTAIYERSCIACHSVVDAQAPLTGHSAAWAARLEERGFDGLLHSAMNGYENMPAMGLCADCSADDFARLIEFMSAQEDHS